MTSVYDTVARRLGRPPKMARSEDAKLVAAALARIGCNLGQLAERLGLGGPALLSRAHAHPLPPQRRAELVRMLELPASDPMLTNAEIALLRALSVGRSSPVFRLSWRVLEAEGFVAGGALTPAGLAWLRILDRLGYLAGLERVVPDELAATVAAVWSEACAGQGLDPEVIGVRTDPVTIVLPTVFGYWRPNIPEGGVPAGPWAEAVPAAIEHVLRHLEGLSYVISQDRKRVLGRQPRARALDEHEAAVMHAARAQAPRALAPLRSATWYITARAALTELGYVIPYGRGRSAGLGLSPAGLAWLAAHPEKPHA